MTKIILLAHRTQRKTIDAEVETQVYAVPGLK
jgi:hypothetical protein